MKNSIKIILTLIVLFIIVMGFYFLTSKISLLTGKGILGSIIKSDPDNFAKCLAKKDVKMYGTEWCGFCKKQREMFGESFEYVDYVDCDKNKQECIDGGVNSYPTWKINGESYSGVQSLEKLSQLSGCSL